MHRCFSVNFEKFLEKLFCRTPNLATISHMLFFYFLQISLQPKNNSFGVAMVNQRKEFTSLFNPV